MIWNRTINEMKWSTTDNKKLGTEYVCLSTIEKKVEEKTSKSLPSHLIIWFICVVQRVTKRISHHQKYYLYFVTESVCNYIDRMLLSNLKIESRICYRFTWRLPRSLTIVHFYTVNMCTKWRKVDTEIISKFDFNLAVWCVFQMIRISNLNSLNK